MSERTERILLVVVWVAVIAIAAAFLFEITIPVAEA